MYSSNFPDLNVVVHVFFRVPSSCEQKSPFLLKTFLIRVRQLRCSEIIHMWIRINLIHDIRRLFTFQSISLWLCIRCFIDVSIVLQLFHKMRGNFVHWRWCRRSILNTIFIVQFWFLFWFKIYTFFVCF